MSLSNLLKSQESKQLRVSIGHFKKFINNDDVIWFEPRTRYGLGSYEYKNCHKNVTKCESCQDDMCQHEVNQCMNCNKNICTYACLWIAELDCEKMLKNKTIKNPRCKLSEFIACPDCKEELAMDEILNIWDIDY